MGEASTPTLVAPDIEQSHESLQIGANAPPVAALFSMHARGVPLLERQNVFNCSEQILSLGRQWRDVGSSFCTLILIQSWTTVFTVLLSIMSISFFTYGPADDQFPLDISYVGFLILLPTLGYACLTFARREEALRQLSALKSGLLWVAVSSRPDHATTQTTSSPGKNDDAVRQTIWELLEAMRAYLYAPRFYANQYPFTGVRGAMGRIAQERAHHLRRINACFLLISRNTKKECNGQLAQAHLAFERLSNIKEFRLPQHLRAVTRIGVTVIIPVFVGPFWASYYRSTTSFSFALLIGTLLNMLLVAFLNIGLDLEDPFDNQGMDMIYIDEPFNEIQQNMYMDIDAEMAAPPPYMGLSPPVSPQPNGGSPSISPKQQASRRSRSPASQPAQHTGSRLRQGGTYLSNPTDDVPLSTDL